MGEINLRPQEVGAGGNYDAVPDLNGLVYSVATGQVSGTIEGGITVYVTIHPNYLESKLPAGFYVNSKNGFGDVYIRSASIDSFEIVRNEDIDMEIVIY